jgi:hypothetical protein
MERDLGRDAMVLMSVIGCLLLVVVPMSEEERTLLLLLLLLLVPLMPVTGMAGSLFLVLANSPVRGC